MQIGFSQTGRASDGLHNTLGTSSSASSTFFHDSLTTNLSRKKSGFLAGTVQECRRRRPWRFLAFRESGICKSSIGRAGLIAGCVMHHRNRRNCSVIWLEVKVGKSCYIGEKWFRSALDRMNVWFGFQIGSECDDWGAAREEEVNHGKINNSLAVSIVSC